VDFQFKENKYEVIAERQDDDEPLDLNEILIKEKFDIFVKEDCSFTTQMEIKNRMGKKVKKEVSFWRTVMRRLPHFSRRQEYQKN
jgi:hypothetical protein